MSSSVFFESVGVPNNVLFPERGTCNLVHQIGEKIDGGFVNQMTLAHFVQRHTIPEDKAKVLLVLTHQPKSHWISVSHKLGVNITALEEKGALVVFDLIKEVFDITKGGQPVDALKNLLNVQDIFQRCEKTIQAFKSTGSRKILVIIEDLTNLLDDVGGSFQQTEKQIMEFLFKLRALTISSFESDRCSVTIHNLIQSPEESGNSMNLSRLAVMLGQSFSPLSFEVSPLRTGFSSQVTGFLKIKCNAKKSSGDGNNRSTQFIRNFHFKLDNNGVRATPL